MHCRRLPGAPAGAPISAALPPGADVEAPRDAALRRRSVQLRPAAVPGGGGAGSAKGGATGGGGRTGSAGAGGMTIVPWLVCVRRADSEGAGNCVVVNSSACRASSAEANAAPRSRRSSRPPPRERRSGTPYFRKLPSAVRPRATEVAAAASSSNEAIVVGAGHRASTSQSRGRSRALRRVGLKSVRLMHVGRRRLKMHMVGAAGMPRRVLDYPLAFAGWNLVSSIGAFLGAFAFVWGLGTILCTVSRG